MSAGLPPAPVPLRWDAPGLGRVLMLGILVVVAALLQVTVVPVLPLVTVTVLAVAHARGAVAGGLAGAWAGFVLDVLPPATGPVGGWMLVLALVGAVVGRAVTAGRPGPVGSLAILCLGAGAAVLGRAAVLWFAGVPPMPGVLPVVLAGAAGGLLLAPAALLAVTPRPRTGWRRRRATRPRGGIR